MKPRVLVVEDNPANLSLMEYLLRAFGYTVVTATDGAEGIEVARRESPDVILMDLQIPKLNGFEAASQLKADPALKRIPIVAVTAFAMVGDRDKILARGFNGYIAKPIEPETFAAQVRAFMPADRRASQPSTWGATQTATSAVPAERTILVVDPAPANLAWVTSMLQPVGYVVVTASTVEQALAIARRQPPDLILSDVQLSGQDGDDLIRRVRDEAPLRSIPFVLWSSTAADEPAWSTLKAQGAIPFLVRPLTADSLIRAIAECLHEDGAR